MTRYLRSIVLAGGAVAALAVAIPPASATIGLKGNAALCYNEPDAPPAPATDVTRSIDLRDATRVPGLVRLSAKGNFSGDLMRVDLNWRQLPGTVPITVTIHLEVCRQFASGHSQVNGLSSFGVAAQQAEAKLAGLTTSDGTPVNVQFDVRARQPGDPPTPGYHEVTLIRPDDGQDLLHSNPDFRSTVEPPTTPWDPTSGGAAKAVWSTKDAVNGTVFAHEAMHLLGLPDRYDNFYAADGHSTKIPDPVDVNDPDAVAAWAAGKGLPAGGRVETRPRRGHDCDLMASTGGCARVLKTDLNRIAQHASIDVHADPGMILLSKTPKQQNFGVGRPFDLTVAPHRTAFANGLTAYCIDETGFVPQAGTIYDVLGPASSRPGTTMADLQAVLSVVAPMPVDQFTEVPGAQEAVWNVTDGASVDEGDPAEDQQAQAILAAAGVAPNVPPDAAHLTDPGAADPETEATDELAPLPPVVSCRGPSYPRPACGAP